MLLVAGPVALVLVFFARPILDLWVGGRFAAEGTAVLQILAAGALINSLACLPQRLLQGVGRPDLTAKFYLLELPLHVALAWLFVRRFGLPGAALAWSVRVGIDFVLLIVAACWVTRTSPRLLAGRDMARTLATLAALAVSFSVLSGASHAPVTQALLTLLLAGAFFLLAWHYALDLEEKWHIRLWFKPAR
jgi:O-antigen/teichoic acid export membrane protein